MCPKDKSIKKANKRTLIESIILKKSTPNTVKIPANPNTTFKGRTMAKNWKKTFTYIVAVFGLIFPGKTVGQKDLPATLFEGIDKIGKQLIKMQQNSRPGNTLRTSPYTPRPVSSKYFPRCKISVGRSNFPQNVCRQNTDPAKMSEAQGFKKIALNNISFLESLLTVGQESMNPIGLQCLKAASKKKLSDIQNVINKLNLESIKIKKSF